MWHTFGCSSALFPIIVGLAGLCKGLTAITAVPRSCCLDCRTSAQRLRRSATGYPPPPKPRTSSSCVAALSAPSPPQLRCVHACIFLVHLSRCSFARALRHNFWMGVRATVSVGAAVRGREGAVGFISLGLSPQQSPPSFLWATAYGEEFRLKTCCVKRVYEHV